MKKYYINYILLALLFFPVLVRSQVTDTLKTPSTKIGRSLIEIGKIIKKEYTDFVKFESSNVFLSTIEGDCSDINFQILKITDGVTTIETKGIYVSTITRLNIRAVYGFIDEEEIPLLIKFIEFILTISKQNSETEVEYLFNSRDLRISFFNEKSSKKGKESKWKCYIDLDKYFSGGNYYFKNGELNTLLTKLKEFNSKN